MAAVRLVPPPASEPPDTDKDPIPMDAADRILDAIKGLSSEVKEVSAKVGAVTTAIAVHEAKQTQHTTDITALEKRVDDHDEEITESRVKVATIIAYAMGAGFAAGAVAALAGLILKAAH